MTPEKSAALLNGAVRSIGQWVEEIESIERGCAGCAGKVTHLRAAMEQAQMALKAVLERDADAE